MPKQPKLNGTPGKKPPAPSVKTRLARTPLAQRSGSKLLEPSVRRQSTRKDINRKSDRLRVRLTSVE